MEDMRIESPKPKTGVVVTAVIASAVIFGGLGYYIGQMYETAPAGTVTYTSPIASTSSKASPSAAASATASTSPVLSKTYTNTKYGYSFSYPDSTSYELASSEGAGVSVPATATSDIVSVLTPSNKEAGKDGGYIFGVSLAFDSGRKLSADAANALYTYNKYESIKIGTADAYKVTVYTDAAKTKASGDIVYLIQLPEGILDVKTFPSDSTSTAIYSSFKLTK